MDHLAKATELAASMSDTVTPDTSMYPMQIANMHATISIAQSLDDLAKLAKRLDPLLARLEEEFAKTEDGKPLSPLEDHAS